MFVSLFPKFPPFLKEYANIKRETTIIGVANRIEIWDRNMWSEVYKNSSGSFEQIAENIMNL